MHRQRLVTAALVVCALGLGCNGNGKGGPDGGGVIPDRCSTDTECATGFRCNRELQRCVCTSDQSCPANLFCNAFTGKCVAQVPGCPTNPCASDEYCDEAVHTCFKRRAFCEECESDPQCGGAGDRCITDTSFDPVKRFCGKACSADGDCPQGTSCLDKGGTRTCWPTTTTCDQLKPCTPDTGQACAADADCTDGTDQTCDTLQGACVARVPTCPFGQVCGKKTELCERACVTDDECNLNPECETSPCRCTNNQCIPIRLCTDDADCEAGTVCIVEPGRTEGECSPSCTADADCPLGKVCTNLGARSACFDSCISNTDCSLAQNCSGGRCITGCQVEEVCELCQSCRPVNAQVNECQSIKATYCQTCTAPPGGCSPVVGNQYCCDIGPQDYIGIECDGTSCPRGFDCYTLTNGAGQVIARNCFPSTGTCTDPTCQ